MEIKLVDGLKSDSERIKYLINSKRDVDEVLQQSSEYENEAVMSVKKFINSALN